MFHVDIDTRTGLIRCRGEGFQTPAEVREHYFALKHAIERCRRTHGCAKILILCADAIPQSADTIQAVQDSWQKLLPGDRMALVVDRALPRLQAARSFLSENTQAFSAEPEALAWLDLPATRAAG